MIMDKDPAFLFYSKDWLEGTAEMFPEEKGVYIDLLAHQHQRGELPSDSRRLAKMVGISSTDFDKIWEGIKHKFERTLERTLNRKLERVMSERYSKGRKNKLIGTFGFVLKKLDLPKSTENELRKMFNVNELLDNDFKNIDSERYTERCTEWCQNAIAVIGNANEDKNTTTYISTTRDFYNKQLSSITEKNGASENYRTLVDFLYGKNELGKQMDCWLQLRDQLSYDQFQKLLRKSVEKKRKIKDMIISGYNDRKYLKGKVSFYATLNSWMNR